MKSSLRFVSLIIFCLLLSLSFTLPALAAAGNGTDSLSNPAGEIIGIANKGLWHEYPENSPEGIVKAAQTGIDYVLADISFTKDNRVVLMEENSADRMLAGATSPAVADYTYDEIVKLKLRNRSGGQNNEVTDFTVAALEDALSAFDTLRKLSSVKTAQLMLKTDVNHALPLIARLNAYYENQPDGLKPALYITGNQKAVTDILPQITKDYAVITEKRSNIVFNITSFIDTQYENGCAGVCLKTANRYGVIFNQTVLKHCKNIRAVISTADSVTAGYREDTVKWWDDVISRGYSVIITDDAEGFVAYKEDCDNARARLSDLFGYVNHDWQPPDFRSTALNDYYKAYTDAFTQADSLLNDNSSSLQDLNDAYTALQNACDEIDKNFEALTLGSAGLTVTPVRIFLCIAAAGTVLAVQIFFYKKRR